MTSSDAETDSKPIFIIFIMISQGDLYITECGGSFEAHNIGDSLQHDIYLLKDLHDFEI